MNITQLTPSGAILYAVMGMAVVMGVLALLAALVWATSKLTAAAQSRRKAVKASPEQQVEETPRAASPPQVTLTGCDEATAAVLMAVVAARSGIPPNRLAFHTIRLLEESE